MIKIITRAFIACAILFTTVVTISKASNGSSSIIGFIPQKVAALKSQNVFPAAINPFTVVDNDAFNYLSQHLKNYTLLNVSAEGNKILQTQPQYLNLALTLNGEK